VRWKFVDTIDFGERADQFATSLAVEVFHVVIDGECFEKSGEAGAVNRSRVGRGLVNPR